MGMGTILQNTRILWLTDLHLDRANPVDREALYENIRRSVADTVLVTGDISIAKHLPLHLRELAAAAAWRQVYFVLGNHDFYGSSFSRVDSCAAGVCRAHVNLQHLGNGEVIRLSSDTALIGHRGWGDGRMGWGVRSFARNPDFGAIEDFQGLNRSESFKLLEQLGRDSASYFRILLPYALSCYRHVLVATHVPTYTQAAYYCRKPCDWLRQPFYSNISAGGAILRIAQQFRKSKVTVLAGHTHSKARFQACKNLELIVGDAKPGKPCSQGVFEFSSDGMQFQSQEAPSL